MKEKIISFILSLGIKVYHKMEKLTEKEIKAQELYFDSLSIEQRNTEALFVGIVGLVGSGKTTVSEALAPLIGATVVKADDIRVLLRNEGEKYDNARLIAENVATEVVNKGGSAIIDSDFIDQKKRVSLKEKAKKVGAKVIFIRTYAELDTMIGRIFSANYENIPEDFFGGASSVWQGGDKRAVVKEREMISRLLSHYNAVNIGNGRYKFELKKLPFKIFAEIDMTSENKWRQEIKMVAGQIRSYYY